MQLADLSANATHSISDTKEASASGVSWPAVFAGALSAAALYLILLSLGAGFGLSSVSPWYREGLSSSEIKISGIIWLIVMEVLSSGMGGYLAGRLRTKWTGIHSDEVYFRDTAHGFLAWCAALVLTAGFLATAATSLLGHSISSNSQEAAQTSGQSASFDSYFVDKLFRTGGARTEAIGISSHAEAKTILVKALAQGSLKTDDKAYLDQLVSNQTGLNTVEADSRVSAVFADEQDALASTQKAVADSLLWIFITLLIGAFTASFAATIGGRQRDHVVSL